MSRVLAILIGIVLGGLAGVVMAIASLIDPGKFLGPEMLWFEPYFRLSGVALGGLILVAAFVVVGVGVGRWRRPVPNQYRRSEEVRW